MSSGLDPSGKYLEYLLSCDDGSPRTSGSAFADHYPPTSHSGQQNEVMRGEEERKDESRQKAGHAVNKKSKKFFDNSEVEKNKTGSFQKFHDLNLMKVQDVAQILGCTAKDIYTFSYECGLPTRRLGGRVKILGKDLKRWLENLPTKRSSSV